MKVTVNFMLAGMATRKETIHADSVDELPELVKCRVAMILASDKREIKGVGDALMVDGILRVWLEENPLCT